MGGPDAFSCKFDELGRFQFRRLCRELVALELGVKASDWEEALVVPGGVRLPGAERPLAGPTLVASLWSRAGAIRPPLERVLRESHHVRAGSLLVLTNAYAAEETVPGLDVRILDASALTRIVLSSPRLRLRLPSLLGISPEATVV
ncbi:MAG TPA: hypothetical protein VF232_04840, partial [Gaiellaceae bacterium]